MIVNVSPDMAVDMWPVLAPMFKRVTDTTNGCYAPADVLREILTGQQTLWVGWDEEAKKVDIAMTTAIIDYPRRRTCKVVYVAGDNMAAHLGPFMSLVEQYARTHGATALEGCYRRGWARAAGFTETGATLFKDLN